MYAIIETGGKQFKVSEGDIINIEKIDVEVGQSYDFTNVLMISNDDLKVGNPFLASAKVTATVVEQAKDKKIVIFKYKPKKDHRKKRGHRQPFTKVKIEKING